MTAATPGVTEYDLIDALRRGIVIIGSADVRIQQRTDPRQARRQAVGNIDRFLCEIAIRVSTVSEKRELSSDLLFERSKRRRERTRQEFPGLIDRKPRRPKMPRIED